MNSPLAAYAFVLAAGCSAAPPDTTTDLTTLPSEATDPCAADVTTEVPAADVPFDLEAVASRSGTRVVPGAWADGGGTSVSVEVDVRSDAAFRLTPEDATCSVGERWKVEADVSVWTADGDLTSAWTEQTSAEVSAPWSLGVILDEAQAAALRATAGFATSAEPYAAISITWDEAVNGAVTTHGDDDDADLVVLAFE